jgi:CBS domain containing-hemolysin-like protein
MLQGIMKSLRRIVRDALIKGGLLRARLSEDELRQVIEASSLRGTIDRMEHELIKSVLEFSDITAKEIMVPRPDIVALDISMSHDLLLEKVVEEGYSRLPVYQGTIDHIIGIIYSKDLLSLLQHRSLIILQDIIRPVYFVPESKKISVLLREFQQKKVHLGVVIDEFGGTEGIVTMEDIVEEIVGDILDEYDESRKSVEQASDGSVFADAALSISEFNRQFRLKIPESPDYETVAGYLQKITGRLPELNEEIKTDNFTFLILTKSARRLRQVKVTPILKPVAIEK